MHVAVTGVAAPDDHRTALLRNYCHLCQKLGDLGTRDDRVDDLVGARGLGGEEGALARLDQLGRRAWRQHVHVEGAERGDQVTERLDVLVEPSRVARLEDDDKVGERCILDRWRRSPARARALR